MQLPPSRAPLPVEHALETPPKVAQLAMLELRAAIWLMRTADEVARAVHFNCNPLPVIQSNQRVDAVPGNLATMLFLHFVAARADFSYHIRLELRRLPFFAEESVAASLP